jgi:predicted negative regulator of RcsB-dependent stress response
MRGMALLLALFAATCSRAREPGSLADEHARVDNLLRAGESRKAERELDRMRRELLRGHAESTEFGRQALKDVAFRLGQVMLDENKPSEALDVCTRGLALGEKDDLFTANLLILRGNVQQELGKSSAAAEDFHQALVINEKLLHKVLHP